MRMHKLIALLLTVAVMLSCAACGSTPAAPEATPAAAPTEEPAPASTEVPASTPAPEAAPSENSNPEIQKMYSANDLATVLKNHSSVTVTIREFAQAGSPEILYEKIIEVSNTANGGYHVRIHYSSAYGSAEMEGDSALGYIASEWNDGHLEVACSLPHEFLSLAQEVWLDPLYFADYTNVTVTSEGGVKKLTAEMSYTGDEALYEEVFFLDPNTDEILVTEESFYADQNGSFTNYAFSYDQPYDFAATNVLDKVKNAADAVDLTLVYCAPEYAFTNTCTYHISASAIPFVDTDGYFRIYSSPEFTPESKLDSLKLNGNTTAYVLVTSYEADVKALMHAVECAESNSGAAATPVPEVTPVPNVTITKSPTSETVTAGGKAVFVAHAQNATATTWILVSPDAKISMLAADGASYFASLRVAGLGTDTITLSNIPKAMDGWRVQCYFSGVGGPVYTSGAYLTVKDEAPAPTPTPAPTPAPVSDMEALAKTMASVNCDTVHSRSEAYGWSSFSVSDFSYTVELEYADYNVNANYRDFTIAYHFMAFPASGITQPVSVVVNRNGIEVLAEDFSSDYNTSWAQLQSSIEAVTSLYVGPIDTHDEPVITPEPAPEPAPVIPSDCSGAFRGGTTTLLSLVVKWNATPVDATTMRLELYAYAESSTLYTNDLADGITFRIGDQLYTATAAAISDSSKELTQALLASCLVDITDEEIPVTVTWLYNGTYSNTHIDSIIAAATLRLR